jgi:hypothetical protein
MTTYFIYTWGLIPIEKKGIVSGALRIFQNKVYPVITSKLYNSFGYSMKEVRKLHPTEEKHMVYIKGTKKECEEYKTKLLSAGFGSVNDALEGVQSNTIFRLLPANIRANLRRIPPKGQAVEFMIEKLNSIGIFFTYNICTEAQYKKIASEFE